MISANQVRVATTPAASTVKQVYSGENQEHSVALVMDFGAKIRLEDGSIWEINPSDCSKTMEWLVAQRITVARGVLERYPFRFTCIDKNTAVDARLVSSP